MMIITIRPCLLGFQVETRHVNGYSRFQGIFPSFGEIVKHLIFTESEFTLEIK